MTSKPDITTLADAARVYGVTRQNIEQLMARSVNPPQPITEVCNGQVKLFDRSALHQWWVNYHENAWRERRVYRRGPTKQVNIRVPLAQFEQLVALREPGQTVAAVATEIFLPALAARAGALEST